MKKIKKNIIKKRIKIINGPELKIFSNPWKKAIGQMFRIKPFNLIFPFTSERIVCIHMFFVFFSLDIIWLNSKKEIIGMKTLKPFQIYSPGKKSKYVIELPKGSIKKYKFLVGKKLTFSSKDF